MSHIHVVSFGLNVGSTEPANQLDKTLRAASLAFGAPLAVAMGKSHWEGTTERFLQVTVLCPVYLVELRAPRVARDLGQEAIAYIRPDADAWTLAYADTTKGRPLGGSVEEFPIISDVPTEA